MKTKLLRKLRKGLFIVYITPSREGQCFHVYSGGSKKPEHLYTWSTLARARRNIHEIMVNAHRKLKRRQEKRENLELYDSKIYP